VHFALKSWQQSAVASITGWKVTHMGVFFTLECSKADVLERDDRGVKGVGNL